MLDPVKYPVPECMHVYKGYIWPANSPPEAIDSLGTVNIRQGDWMVATYPKSGTTWMQEILYLIGTDGDTTEADRIPLHLRAPYLENSTLQPLIADLPIPRVIKTHLPVDMIPQQVWDQNVKIVHVSRNPKDVAVSLYHFYRANVMLGSFTGTWSLFFDMFISGNVINGLWSSFVKGWLTKCQSNKNIFFLSFEELLIDPKRMITKVSEFLGKSLSDDTVGKIAERTSFTLMKQNPNTNLSNASHIIKSDISPFMRKGEAGDWKNYFTVTQNKLFDELFEKDMQDVLDVDVLQSL